MTWQPQLEQQQQVELDDSTAGQWQQLRLELLELSRALVAELRTRGGLLALAVVMALALGLAYLVEHRADQLEREAYCASMGETWQDGHQVEGGWMPGQCVDQGQQA